MLEGLGYSRAQIAERLGISAADVRAGFDRLRRAGDALKAASVAD